MGQKVNPTGFRLGTSKKQNANWYAKGKDFSTNLIQDLKVREYFKKKLKNSSISRIELERSAENFVVSIYTSRPGIIIGKGGQEVDKLKEELKKITSKEIILSRKQFRTLVVVRSIYSEVLNIIQPIVIYKLRKNKKLDEKKYLNDALLTSIAGISAAMKNTG